MNRKSVLKMDTLNEKQLYAFKEIISKKSQSVIQAGPGAGKSYLAHHIIDYLQTEGYNVTVVIYKHDLLSIYKQKNPATKTRTVASFFMTLLHIGFFQWQGLGKQMNANMPLFVYNLATLHFLKKIYDYIKYKNLKPGKSMMIFDEYTILDKSMLWSMSMVCKLLDFFIIWIGDHNQHQSIGESTYMGIDSLEICKLYSQVYTLDQNIRCDDGRHNEILEKIKAKSSNEKIGIFGYLFMTALYPTKVFEKPKIENIQMAAEHRILSNIVHSLVLGGNYPVDYYMYEDGSKTDAHKHLLRTGQVLKYMPYVPLIIGHPYYILNGIGMEKPEGVLKEINVAGYLVFLIDDRLIKIKKCNVGSLLSSGHFSHLQKPGVHLIGFPVLPITIMTMHISQGITISRNVDIAIANANYRGLYVAASRVKTPKQINSIFVENGFNCLVNVILLFPELVNSLELSPELVEDRIFNNSICLYEIPQTNEMITKLTQFYFGELESRKKIRNELCSFVKHFKQRIITYEQSNVKSSLALDYLSSKESLFAKTLKLKEVEFYLWWYQYLQFDNVTPKTILKTQSTLSSLYSSLFNIPIGSLETISTYAKSLFAPRFSNLYKPEEKIQFCFKPVVINQTGYGFIMNENNVYVKINFIEYMCISASSIQDLTNLVDLV